MGQNHELSRKIYNKKLISKISKKIKLLGLSSNLDPIDFLNMRFIVNVNFLSCHNFCYLNLSHS